jgi:hypothetical protein
MIRQNKLVITQNLRRERLKSLLICLIGLLFITNIAFSQEVAVPESLKKFPTAKCYWSYSVERLSTTHDSVHNYIIRVQLEQQDSLGNHKGRLRLKHALIYCNYVDKGIPQKIYFKQKGLQWIAKFKVSTNEPVPLRIIASSNQHQRIMPLTFTSSPLPAINGCLFSTHQCL